MKHAPWTLRLFGIVTLLGLMLAGAGTSRAQGDSHTFPETNQTVSGTFWQYWQGHGGLAQQGYPISGEIQEKSDLNGQTYTVQYFERAVFEKHPENQAPYNVLLSQLGTFRYKAKYGTAGAPNQQVDGSNAQAFPQTGHSIGGKFRTYWEGHGGLAQQGYPISDEFTEISDLNGQPYTVQYFERAVFELHPENQAPYDVLLSQLGTFQYRCKYQGGACPGSSPAATPTAPPAPPAATATPGGSSGGDCANIPASQNQTVTPTCGPRGTLFRFEAAGFKPGEKVGIYATQPSGAVFGAPFQATADGSGRITGITLQSNSSSELGVWADTMEGTVSHTKSIGYFKVTGPVAAATPPPSSGCDTSADKDGSATPSSAKIGDRITIRATGFQKGEKVSLWFTTPNQVVVGTSAPAAGLVNPDGSIGPLPITLNGSFFQNNSGRWAITFQGASSGHQSVIYFCVSQ